MGVVSSLVILNYCNMIDAKEEFEAKAHYNQWLLSLTESEKALIIQMIEEAYGQGREDGAEAQFYGVE